MNEFNKNLPYGATPIDRNESKQLIPKHLQNLAELNEFEQKNILKALSPIDEIAVRLHHKLVFIHPFSNGNGRHARLYCDTFLKLNSHTPFTWGKINYSSQSTRKEYIEALRNADNKDYTKLLKFVKS